MAPKPSLTYFLCVTARSGSSKLCEMLCSLKTAGKPNEWYNDEWYNDDAVKRFGPSEYLERIFSAYTGPNGVFGIKLMWHHFYPRLVQGLRKEASSLQISDRELLASFFPNLHYIYLTRRDKLAQAVSMLRAWQTGIWHRYNDGGIITTNTLIGGGEKFEGALVTQWLETFKTQEDCWENFFRENSIIPHRMYYEDLFAPESREFEKLMSFLGIPLEPGVQPRSLMVKMADKTTALWISKYKRIRFRKRLLAPFYFLKKRFIPTRTKPPKA